MLSLVETLKAPLRWTWPQVLLAAYGFTFFLPNISRYKGLILILLLATAVTKIVRGRARIIDLWNSNAIRALLLLSTAVLYGCLISPDSRLSFGDARTFFLHCLLVGLLWPLALRDTPPQRIAIALTTGFAAGLVVLLAKDIGQYYSDLMEGGIAFGSDFNHRELSYALLVTAPFAFVGTRSTIQWIRTGGFLILSVAAISLIGTLARGAWLAGCVVLGFWMVHYRAWKLAVTLGIVAGIFAIGWITLFPNSLLNAKLHQTDSSQRWGGGVQSAAIDLIMENPWRGYGFGDEIYANVYNARVGNHPEWTVRESIGPHNTIFRMWIASGILGLLGILAMYTEIVRNSLAILKRTSGSVHHTTLAVLLAFVGAIFVRGMFESAYMNYFGWIVGMLAAFSELDSKPATPSLAGSDAST